MDRRGPGDCQGLLDEEVTGWSGRPGVAHHRAEPALDAAVAVDDDAALRDVDPNVPLRGCAPRLPGADPARVSVGAAGEPDSHPGPAVCVAQHWEDGSNTREGPQGLDVLELPCMHVRRRPGDVVVLEHHERLAHGHPRGTGVRRCDGDAHEANRQQRGERCAGGLGQPVNRAGPRRGWRTWAAQAR